MTFEGVLVALKKGCLGPKKKVGVDGVMGCPLVASSQLFAEVDNFRWVQKKRLLGAEKKVGVDLVMS